MLLFVCSRRGEWSGGGGGVFRRAVKTSHTHDFCSPYSTEIVQLTSCFFFVGANLHERAVCVSAVQLWLSPECCLFFFFGDLNILYAWVISFFYCLVNYFFFSTASKGLLYIVLCWLLLRGLSVMVFFSHCAHFCVFIMHTHTRRDWPVDCVVVRRVRPVVSECTLYTTILARGTKIATQRSSTVDESCANFTVNRSCLSVCVFCCVWYVYIYI